VKKIIPARVARARGAFILDKDIILAGIHSTENKACLFIPNNRCPAATLFSSFYDAATSATRRTFSFAVDSFTHYVNLGTGGASESDVISFPILFWA
jgi:hypothetical protein